MHAFQSFNNHPIMPGAVITPGMRGIAIGMRYNYTPEQIAARIKCSPRSVRRLFKRVDSEGEKAALHAGKSTGRPPALSEAQELDLIDSIRRDHQKYVSQHAQERRISRRTVTRCMKEHRLVSAIQQRRPFLSARSIFMRFMWSYWMSQVDFRKLFYSDESCFRLGGFRQLIIRPIGAAMHAEFIGPRLPGEGQALHIWGVIGFNIKLPLVAFRLLGQKQLKSIGNVGFVPEASLVPSKNKKGETKMVLPSTIGAPQYQEQILQQFFDRTREEIDRHCPGWELVEDNAPPHNCATSDRVREQQGLRRSPHPPCSPE